MALLLGVKVPCGPSWKEPRAEARVSTVRWNLKEAEGKRMVVTNRNEI